MNEIKIYEEIFSGICQTAVELANYSGMKKNQKVELLGYAVEKNSQLLQKKEPQFYSLCNCLKNQDTKRSLSSAVQHYVKQVFVFSELVKQGTIEDGVIKNCSDSMQGAIDSIMTIMKNSVVEYTDIQKIHKI